MLDCLLLVLVELYCDVFELCIVLVWVMWLECLFDMLFCIDLCDCEVVEVFLLLCCFL